MNEIERLVDDLIERTEELVERRGNDIARHTARINFTFARTQLLDTIRRMLHDRT